MIPALQRRPELAAFLFAALVHMLFWIALPERMQRNQSTDYFEVNEPVARQIAAGRGITLPNGDPATAKAPGQSILLAGTFAVAAWTGLSETFVQRAYIVAAMGLGAALLYRLFALLLWPRVALWGVAIWTLHPMTLWIAKQPNTEVPFFALLFGVLLLGAQVAGRAGKGTGLRGLLCGVLLGLAMLVRPIGILLPGVLLVWLWLGPRLSFRRLTVFAVGLAAGCALAVGPWEVWVWQQSGRWILLGDHGTGSLMDGLTFGVKGDASGGTLVRDELLPLMQDMFDEQLAQRMNTNGQVFSYLFHRFQQEPLLVAELFAVKAVRSWFGTNAKSMEIAIALVQIPFLAFTLRGGRRFWRAGPRQRSFALLCLLLTGYFWSMTVIALSIVRYLLPPMAVLSALTAAGAGLGGEADTSLPPATGPGML